jgi:hypothetical protein
MTDFAFPNPNKEMRPVISRLISFIQVKYLLVGINSPEGCTCSTPGFSQFAALVSSFTDTILYSLYLNLPPVFPILTFKNHASYI